MGVRPMLARTGRLPADDGAWGYEFKWDGVRAIVSCRGGVFRLQSRGLKDITGRYPELAALGAQLGPHEVVLDGEIVAFDDDGIPSFELLQRRMHVASKAALTRLARDIPVTYLIFDLLHFDGRRTMSLPYIERRQLLSQLKLSGPTWQTPPFHEGDGGEVLTVSAEHGLEGIVAKRLSAPYRPGARSGDWLKIKNVNRQELVVGGWVPGKGTRQGQLGALLLGYHEQPQGGGMLRYAGRVGSGFDEPALSRLMTELSARARQVSPFSPRGAQPPKSARFVVPELVVEVEFANWTQEGVLRHPVYKGLRDDKSATEVGMETLPAPYRIVHETKRSADIEVDGHTMRLSNRGKVLYPSVGFTKGQLIDYYATVAPVLLPHLKGRPLTLKRYPNGVEGQHFYEKRCPAHRPDWVLTVPIWSERGKEDIPYCVVENLPTLIWVANLADIELHVSLSMARKPRVPTMMVFDLDPGVPAGLKECCHVALLVRELFVDFGLETLVKTSGSKGLQVYVPINTPTSYEITKPFARAVAELLEKHHTDQVVSHMAKSLRVGKVFIDWSQNDEHKTTVSVYSLRATPSPLVSTPLLWEEVERGSRRRSAFQLSATPDGLIERLQRYGDLFEALPVLKQKLPKLSGR